jgi:PIN domain nuclease of toxin-antitoxin system
MLLDTCALLWLTHKQENFSENILSIINKVPVLYISSISAFEISLKHRNGKLQLPAQPCDWFKTIIEYHGISVIDLNIDICIKATELPQIHKDPCDRFIIASAIIYNMPVITSDKIFEKYGIKVLI